MIKTISEYMAPVIIVVGLGSFFVGLCELQAYADARRTKAPITEVCQNGDCAPACSDKVKALISCTTDLDCVEQADKIGREYNCFFADEI